MIAEDILEQVPRSSIFFANAIIMWMDGGKYLLAYNLGVGAVFVALEIYAGMHKEKVKA